MYDIIFIGKSDSSFLKLKERFPTAKQVVIKTNVLDAFNEAKRKAFTKMFWVVWDDITVDSKFDFNYKATTWDEKYIHLFLNGETYDGICLFPKDITVSNRELSCRFFINKKETGIKASTPLPYEKFVISTYDDYLNVIENCCADMCWIIPSDVVTNDDFKFNLYFSHHNQYDRKVNHIFKNGEYYDGIILASKHKIISNREFNYRFLVDKKEWDIVASTPKPFEIFYINSYDDYLNAAASSATNMFYAVFGDLVVTDFKFDYQVPKFNQHITHVFKNGEYYDGVCLFSKNNVVSKKEFDYRFFANKKEVDIVASTPKPFETFYINSYDDYLTAANTTSLDMFYVVFDDVVVTDFKFDYYVPVYDTFHRNITHVFKNGEYYDGVCLFSKNNVVSKKEFDYRFFANKKEVDIVASTPKPFEIFKFESYDDYLVAIDNASTNMFYGTFNDIVIQDNFKFDYQVPKFNQHITHVFKNGEYYDGVCLFSKKIKVAEREFDYRFFANKKEVDIVASTPKPFDIVFISYFEKFADDNFQKLLEHAPSGHSIYRVSGIKGIHQAHRCAASLVQTDMFWVVDADAILDPSFKFDFPQVVKHDTYTKSIVHVWRSINPINGLEYGYGGVKLLPTKLTLDMDISNPDMTTSISASFKSMPAVSNVAGFNTDPFTTWRSAFRECVKLASKTIQGQIDQETEERLNIWCAVGADTPFGEYAIAGAIAGRNYGQENAGNIPALALINDYDWLRIQFEQTH